MQSKDILMTIFTKKTLLKFILPTIILIPTIHSMELAQKPIETIKANLYIFPHPMPTALDPYLIPTNIIYPICYTTNNITNIKKPSLNTPSVVAVIEDKKTKELLIIEEESALKIPLSELLSAIPIQTFLLKPKVKN